MMRTALDAGAPLAPVEAEPSGTPPAQSVYLGDFELLQEIGRGGMGIVYRARQRSVGRMVAVKILHPGRLLSASEVDRFRQEAETVARLEHPNIVPVYDAGEDAGQPWCAMKLVPGGTLANTKSPNPVAPGNEATFALVADSMRQIALAIQHAHQRGVLHRDLKPSNILLDEAGQPYVTDFGLARLLDQDSALTRTGAFFGSPAYSAPEQAASDGRKVTTAADIYGLGAILYELLTGRPPFMGATPVETLRQVLESEPTKPHLIRKDVPLDLETICLKCLEKDPERRYLTAQELADELERFLRDEPILARPLGVPARLSRWCRRKPALATLIGLVFLLLLTVLMGTPVALLKINRARLELKRDLYAADMRLASEALRAGALDQVQDLLNRHRSDQGIESNPPFEWRYLRHASDNSDLLTHQFPGLTGTRLSPYSGSGMSPNILFNFVNGTDAVRAWDTKTWEPRPLKLPSGSGTNWTWLPCQQAAISVSDADNTLAVYRLPSLTPAAVIKVPGKPTAWAVSPGFQTVGVGFEGSDQHHILLWDLVSNAQSPVEGNYQGRVTRLEFSTDGTVLAAACDDGLVELWSIPEAKTLPSPPRDPSTVKEAWEGPLFFMPGSTRLYLNRGRERSILESWDWNSQRLLAYQVPSGHITALDVSSDGALVAVGTSSGTIALVETPNLRQVGTISYNGAPISCLKFSPSNKLIASGSLDSSARLWEVKTLRGVGMLNGNKDRMLNVAFTPDQKSVLTFSGDATFKVWDLSKILRKGVLWQATNHIYSFALSRDQTRMAGKDFGQIFVWDTLTGKEILRVQTGELENAEQGSAISYSPTDQLLAWSGWNRVELVDCNSGRIQSLEVHRWGFCNPAFSPDGREFAFATSTNIMIWDTRSGAKRPFVPVESTVFGLAFSPDGSRLATGQAAGTVTLWDRKRGTRISSTQAHKADVFAIAFSPDGRFLATGSADGTGKLWVIMPGGLRLRYLLRGHAGRVGVTFSPDGKRVLSCSDADNFMKLWDTETGLEVATIYENTRNPVFSRDGSVIYSAGEDGNLRTWEAPRH